MTLADVDTTYEPYSQDPGYIAANAALIEALDLSEVTRVADLACGTGLLSGVLHGRKPEVAIGGIDLDPVQIGIARRTFPGPTVETLEALRAAAARGEGAAWFTAGSAMELPFEDGELDLIVQGNSIHLMPDRPAFLAEVARVLRPGGQFTFNSVFYVGTYVEGSEPVFTEWMKQATYVLDELNAERAARGEAPVKRVRGKGGKAFRKDWLSKDGWAAALAEAGIEVTYKGDRNVPISAEGLGLVGAYGGLAEVLMSGYPVDVASHCLMEAAPRAFDKLGIAEVPRNWLEIRAVKT
jgi:ubiquinone/menaquinone biosynthesis C-methylase UbiE